MQNTVWVRFGWTLRSTTILTFLVLLAKTGRAENNTDYIFNGPTQTTNFGAALYIPMSSPGTNNSLQILNGGAVTNAGGAIGLNRGDNFNYAIVSGSGSIWQNNGSLSVGSGGSDNLLLITNGGMVNISSGSSLYLGSTGSTNNTIIVTDPGSILNAPNISYFMAGYAGTGSRLIVTNGGTVLVSQTWVGGWPGGSNHFVQVTGTDSLLTNNGVVWIGVYPNSGGNHVTVDSGGKIADTGVIIGYDPSGGGNVVGVTGTGSVWISSGAFEVGGASTGNQFTLSQGGMVRAAGGFVAGYGGSFNNTLVTDPGTLLDQSGVSVAVGAYGNNSQMTISNGAHVVSAYGYLGSGDARGSNNVLLVTGAGSVMSNSATTYISYVGSSNKMIISNGGRVDSGDAYFNYYLAPGNNWYGNQAAAEITGTGSQWNVSGTLVMNLLGYGSDMVISNGGRVSVGGVMQVGGGNSNSTVVVTGEGSILQVGSYITVGKNGVYSSGSNSHLLVTAGGILECNSLVGGSSFAEGSISNVGGVFQFTTATPSVSFGGSGIMMSNATISYRGVSGSDINYYYPSLISKQGNNTFQLDSSTNSSLASYTFNTGNPSNYYRLALKNGRFQATTTTFGSGGVLVGNGTVASDNVTNLGTIAPGFSAGAITFTSNLVLGSTSVLAMEIGGTNPVDYDRLIVNGSLTLTGTLSIAMINSFAPTAGDTFTLIDNTGSDPVSGFFSGLTNNAFIDASANGIDAFFRIQYDAGTGNDVVLIATIPEPSALALMTVAVCVMLWRKSNRA